MARPNDVSTPIRVTAHPAERNTYPGRVPAQAGASCTCCCCCCLHSIGSLVGAFSALKKEPTAPAWTQEAEDYADEPNPATADPHGGPSVSKVFWLSTLAVVATICAFAFGSDPLNPEMAALGAALVIVLTCPGILLIAGLFSVIFFYVQGGPSRSIKIRHVGQLALAIVLGGLAGTLVMLFLLVLLIFLTQVVR